MQINDFSFYPGGSDMDLFSIYGLGDAGFNLGGGDYNFDFGTGTLGGSPLEYNFGGFDPSLNFDPSQYLTQGAGFDQFGGFTQGAPSGAPGATTGGTTGGITNPDGSINWSRLLQLATGAVGAAGGLASIGAGIGGALGGGGTASRTTTGTTTSGPPPMSPEMLQLLGSAGGAGGVGGGGLLGLAGQATSGASNLMGLQNQMLGNLAGMQLPQLNPQIASALGQNALALSGQIPSLTNMAQGLMGGNLPALTPQLQALVNQTFQGQLAGLGDQFLTSAEAVKERLAQQGFYGDISEGPTQAMLGPALKGYNLGLANIGGMQAQSQLGLAQQLPQMALQQLLGAGQLGGQVGNLAQQGFNLQAAPFNFALQQANALTGPLALQAQMPFDLLRLLGQQQGTRTVESRVGPEPTLAQNLQQYLPLISGGLQALGQGGGQLFGTTPQTLSGV